MDWWVTYRTSHNSNFQPKSQVLMFLLHNLCRLWTKFLRPKNKIKWLPSSDVCLPHKNKLQSLKLDGKNKKMLIDCIMQVNRNELITTKTNTRIKTYCLSSSSYQKSTNLKIRLTRAHVHVNFNYRNFSSCWVRVANTVGPCSPTQVSVKTSQQAFLHWKIPTVKLASLRHASYNVTSSFLERKRVTMIH